MCIAWPTVNASNSQKASRSQRFGSSCWVCVVSMLAQILGANAGSPFDDPLWPLAMDTFEFIVEPGLQFDSVLL